jgi:hypothetical protein
LKQYKFKLEPIEADTNDDDDNITISTISTKPETFEPVENVIIQKDRTEINFDCMADS